MGNRHAESFHSGSIETLTYEDVTELSVDGKVPPSWSLPRVYPAFVQYGRGGFLLPGKRQAMYSYDFSQITPLIPEIPENRTLASLLQLGIEQQTETLLTLAQAGARPTGTGELQGYIAVSHGHKWGYAPASAVSALLRKSGWQVRETPIQPPGHQKRIQVHLVEYSRSI